MVKIIDFTKNLECKGNALYNPILDRIKADIRTANEFDNVYLYEQIIDDNATAYVLNDNGVVTIQLYENCDVDELVEFISIIGITKIITNREIDLPDFVATNGCIMLYKQYDFTNSITEFLSSENVKDLYLHLTSCFNIELPFEEWFCDLSYKLRHGIADISVVRKDSNIVSSAMLIHKDENSAVISSVATNEKFRGQGLAKECIGALINKSNSKRKYIYCENNLIEFYKKIGFEIIGSWYEYVRKIWD